MSELILTAKVESFATVLLPALKNFPSFERHGIVAEIRTIMIKIITNIKLAESVKSKRLVYAQEADGYIEALMATLRICRSKNFKYISNGFYTQLFVLYEEIKRLIVGFIKSAIKK